MVCAVRRAKSCFGAAWPALSSSFGALVWAGFGTDRTVYVLRQLLPSFLVAPRRWRSSGCVRAPGFDPGFALSVAQSTRAADLVSSRDGSNAERNDLTELQNAFAPDCPTSREPSLGRSCRGQKQTLAHWLATLLGGIFWRLCCHLPSCGLGESCIWRKLVDSRHPHPGAVGGGLQIQLSVPAHMKGAPQRKRALVTCEFRGDKGFDHIKTSLEIQTALLSLSEQGEG